MTYPVGGANHRGPFPFLIAELGTEPKVTDLDMPLGIEEDVIGFDVTVDDILAM